MGEEIDFPESSALPSGNTDPGYLENYIKTILSGIIRARHSVFQSHDYASENKFSIPKKRPNEHRSAPGTFYVLGAEENGRFVIQGAGYLSRDITTKPSANAFKVVFSDRTPYELFRKWLVADPPLALKSIFARVLTNLDGKTVDANDPNGVSIGKMAQAVPPKEGHFAFFDGPVTAQPVAHFARNY